MVEIRAKEDLSESRICFAGRDLFGKLLPASSSLLCLLMRKLQVKRDTLGNEQRDMTPLNDKTPVAPPDLHGFRETAKPDRSSH